VRSVRQQERPWAEVHGTAHEEVPSLDLVVKVGLSRFPQLLLLGHACNVALDALAHVLRRRLGPGDKVRSGEKQTHGFLDDLQAMDEEDGANGEDAADAKGGL
jgi:hypothetical protein